MAQNLLPVKREICQIGKRIWEQGLCAGNDGNISVRLAGSRVLCTPTGVSKGFMTPAMMTLVDMEGRQLDKRIRWKRTSEVLLHLQIYARRPDVRAVIHSHAPHATAFACSGIPLPEGIHPEADYCLGKVRSTLYTTPGYADVGRSVCELVAADTHAVLMGNHGAVTFGGTLMDALYKMEMLEAYCRLLVILKQIGQVKLLTGEQMTALLRLKESAGLPDSRLAAGAFGADNGGYLAGMGVAPKAR